MFDRVIRESDDDAGRRSAASFAVTSVLCAAAVGGFVLGGLLFRVAQTPLVVEAPMVMLAPMGGGGADTPLPAVPEKPRPAPAPEVEPDPDASPDPDAAPAAVPVEPTEASGSGTGTGSGTGEGPGDGPGTGEGPPGEGPVSPAPPTVRRIEDPDLVVRRRVDPAYPEAAKALGLGEQRCLATVYIDESGVPYDVDIENCPAAFHSAARQALLEWRWYPPKSGKVRVRTKTAVGITYRIDR